MKVTRTVCERTLKFWTWPNAIFNLTPVGRHMHDVKRKLREFVTNVVVTRTKEYDQMQDSKTYQDDRSIGLKVSTESRLYVRHHEKINGPYNASSFLNCDLVHSEKSYSQHFL